MNADMMAAMPPDAVASISDAQMDMVPSSAVPQTAPMDMDDGGMAALDAAIEPAPAEPAPMDMVQDAVIGGAMDQVMDQGAGAGAPDMGVPPDAGVDAPMDAPNEPDAEPDMPPPDDPIV